MPVPINVRVIGNGLKLYNSPHVYFVGWFGIHNTKLSPKTWLLIAYFQWGKE